MCDYAVQVFYSSLPLYLINDLEQVQKRALSIIYPCVSYNEALVQGGLSRLADHDEDLCKSLFNKPLPASSITSSVQHYVLIKKPKNF